MRAAVRATSLVVISGSLAACAALTGIDGIGEDPCYPDLCPDAAAGPDVASHPDGGVAEASVDAVADSAANGTDGTDGPAVDGVAADGTADVVLADRTGPADASDASDAGPVDAVGTDAPVDAVVDGPVDAGYDAADAPYDAPYDAPDVFSVPDSCTGTVLFQDSFANNAQGWTLDTTWSIAEECATPPAPQKGNPDPTSDHTGTPGSGVVGAFVCGNNPTGATTAFRYATSPAFDASGASTLTLGFWRWLNSDEAAYLASTVDVYDGSAWVNVYTNPTGSGNLVTDAAWTYEPYDVTQWKNAAFRVRFGYSIVATGVYEMSAWNVDDVSVSTPACP